VPSGGQRLTKIPALRVGIMGDEMACPGDSAPDFRRGPQWIDTGAEIDKLGDIPPELARRRIDIAAMTWFRYWSHNTPAPIITPNKLATPIN